MKKQLFVLIFILVNYCVTITNAQYTTIHYIPPSPWQYTNNANELVITTLSKTPVAVTIKTSNGTLITNAVTTVSGTPLQYRFTNVGVAANFLNTVLSGRGLIISALTPIGVQIRNIASDNVTCSGSCYGGSADCTQKGNSSFTSLGDQGLGTSFRVGYYANITGTGNGCNMEAQAPIYGVMARDNGTSVYLNGTLVTTLSAGQCYLLQTAIGSQITSNNPIVCTSGYRVDNSSGCGDGVCSQIIPEAFLGTSYIIVRSGGNTGYERSTIVATQANTAVTVKVNGGATTNYTLAKSGDYITINNGDGSTAYSSSFVSSNSPVAIYTGSASGCEIDMIVQPPLSACSGSFNVQTTKFISNANTGNAAFPYFGYILLQSDTAIVYFNGVNLETLTSKRTAVANSSFYIIQYTNTQLGNPTNLNFSVNARVNVAMVESGGGYSMSSFISSISNTMPPPNVTSNCLPATFTAQNGFASYQWYKDGVLVSGVTSQAYSPTLTGNYSVAGNSISCGSTSISPTVTLSAKPNAGVDQVVCAGKTVTLTGTSPTTATWGVQSNNPSGATLGSTTNGIANVVLSNVAVGNYNFIYNAGCTDTMTLTVKAISTSTTNASICSGSSYTFNGSNYSTAGTYLAYLINAVGCDSVATLNLSVISLLNPSLNITSSASSICTGVNVTFTANVSNAVGASIAYQWNKNGVAIIGATSSTFTTTSAATGDKYTCTITVGASCIVNNKITSNTITITLLDPGTWVGGVDKVWSNPKNWCGAVVPLVNTDVTIPVGATNYPTISDVYPVNNLTIQKGTTLTITGTLQVAGAISNSGVIDATNGTLELNGTAAQTIPVGALKNNTVKNITINNRAGVKLADTLKITGTLTPTVGTIYTDGKLVLKSTSTGTARIATGTGDYISGDVTVERYINQKTARRYNFIGSTTSQTIRDSWQQQIYITGAGTGGQACGAGTGNGGATDKYNSNGFDKTNTNATSIFTYNEKPVNGSRWVGVASTSENLVPGKGYKVNIRGNRNSATVSCSDQLSSYAPTAPENVTLSSTGTITTGDVIVDLNDPAANKYTLLGNPYPSQISFTAFQASNSTSIGTKMWSFSPYGNGNYTTYSAGIIANGATSYDNTNGDFIASGQAFFVEALSTGSVTFSESHKTNGTIPNSQYFGAKNNKLIRIALLVDSSNNRLDEAVIRYNAFGSDSYIPDWDATSMGGGAQTLAIIKGTNRLSIATHPEKSNADIAKIGVKSGIIGTFKLSLSNFEGIDSNKTIFLLDKYLGVTVNVRANAVYRFKITSDTSSKGDNRFVLLVNDKIGSLPVSFKGVKAAKTDKGAVVTFTVANELNLAYYEVERSTDGANFTTIASVKATAENSYTVNDNNLPTSTTVYYRLKSIDLSGETMYSAIAKLNNTTNTQSAISIYPNPVKDQLNITINNANNSSYAVRISTITGKQILDKAAVTTSNNKISIDANAFQSGVYLVELTNANGVKLTQKFIKE